MGIALHQHVKTNGSAKRSRKRNIVWFNPPYSDHIKTNIGKEFLKLVTIHFPHYHRLHRICNKNNIKVSYSCMPNMAAIISKHNKITLKNRADLHHTTPLFNCRNKTNCPLEGKCRKSSIIYKATLKSNGKTRHYYGWSETGFKTHFNNHKQSLVHQKKRNATELSKAVWNAKDTGTNPNIEWSIAAKTSPYQPGAKLCNLCLAEKLTIPNPATMLNKRSELNNKGCQKNKLKLKSFIA